MPSTGGPLRVGAFPACSLPRAVCFSSLGQRQSLFFPRLRNRASEAHNAAVKISGSGLAAAQRAPCSPHRRRAQGPSWACLCWPPAGGAGRGGERPRALLGTSAALGLSTEEGDRQQHLESAGRHVPERCPTERLHVRAQRPRHLWWGVRMERKGGHGLPGPVSDRPPAGAGAPGSGLPAPVGRQVGGLAGAAVRITW